VIGPQAPEYSSKGEILHPRGYWIGVNDRERDGKFTNIDGTPVDYTNWDAGDPRTAGITRTYIYSINKRILTSPILIKYNNISLQQEMRIAWKYNHGVMESGTTQNVDSNGHSYVNTFPEISVSTLNHIQYVYEFSYSRQSS
jgi:hypothetical protein